MVLETDVTTPPPTRSVRTYCGLCSAVCPSLITIEGSRVLSLEPDRDHPRGGAVCAKGRAAPELHDHPHRVNYPLRRTRPKTDPDPGWERCSWDEALDLISARLRQVRESSGPHAVAFSRGTSGGTGLREAEPWIIRLANHFGSPNFITTTHVCNWARDGAAYYTFGESALPMPDVAQSGCIVLWGHNPNATSLGLARRIVAARAAGARLVVIDPRRIGLANKADLLLQVRPGTDGALALAFIHLLIQNGWLDEPFVRDWTNAPFLVREDTGRLLRAEDLAPGECPTADPAAAGYVAIEASSGRPVPYLPTSSASQTPSSSFALRGATSVQLRGGERVHCRTVFDQLAALASRHRPRVAAEITGVPERQIEEAVQLIAQHRPVSHYLFNGLVQHTNGTQSCRAIAVFYALLGDFDRAGGNVITPRPAVANIAASDALSPQQAARRLGRDIRPIGPAAHPGSVGAPDLYTSILEGRPYRVRALLSFGNNMLLGIADTLRGREALQRLEFFAQAELFHTPTSRFADVLLPAASFLEAEALFVSPSGTVQRRPQVVEPLHERRSDAQIIFDLAVRLGMAERFGGGDPTTAYDEALAPLDLTWDDLGAHPYGVHAVPPTRYAKYAKPDADGRPRGFGTPSGKVELFSDTFAAYGFSPLPEYQEPAESPLSTPDLARQYPLVLTNAKRPQYLHSQHRGLPSIRRTAPHPTAELHPDTATAHGIANDDWIVIETPRGRARARAEVTASIIPGVVCANHGWWEGCEELGLPPTDPFDETGANLNLLVHNDLQDPISGGIPHRSSLCRVTRAAPPERQPPPTSSSDRIT